MAAIPLSVPVPPKPEAMHASVVKRALVALLDSYGGVFKGLVDYEKKSACYAECDEQRAPQ